MLSGASYKISNINYSNITQQASPVTTKQATKPVAAKPAPVLVAKPAAKPPAPNVDEPKRDSSIPGITYTITPKPAATPPAYVAPSISPSQPAYVAPQTRTVADICNDNLEVLVNGINVPMNTLVQTIGNNTTYPTKIELGSTDSIEARLKSNSGFTFNYIRNDDGEIQRAFRSDPSKATFNSANVNYLWQNISAKNPGEYVSTSSDGEIITTYLTSDFNSTEFKGWKLNNGWVLMPTRVDTPFEGWLKHYSDQTKDAKCFVGNAYRSDGVRILYGAALIGGAYYLSGASSAASGSAPAPIGGNIKTIFGSPLK